MLRPSARTAERLSAAAFEKSKAVVVFRNAIRRTSPERARMWVQLLECRKQEIRSQAVALENYLRFNSR